MRRKVEIRFVPDTTEVSFSGSPGLGLTASQGESDKIALYFGTLVKGDKGDPGYTPERGVDYWTESDKTDVIEGVIERAGSGWAWGYFTGDSLVIASSGSGFIGETMVIAPSEPPKDGHRAKRATKEMKEEQGMADFTESTINNETRDVNVKDGKLTEAKLDTPTRAKLFPHVWLSEEEFEKIEDGGALVEGMTYLVYEDEEGAP